MQGCIGNIGDLSVQCMIYSNQGYQAEEQHLQNGVYPQRFSLRFTHPASPGNDLEGQAETPGRKPEGVAPAADMESAVFLAPLSLSHCNHEKVFRNCEDPVKNRTSGRGHIVLPAPKNPSLERNIAGGPLLHGFRFPHTCTPIGRQPEIHRMFMRNLLSLSGLMKIICRTTRVIIS